MNKQDNLDLIKMVGDVLQLKFGNNFGYFSVKISRNQLKKFCDIVNTNSWFKHYGYSLDYRFSQDNSYLTLMKNDYSLNVPVILLDHTIYINASKDEWEKINKDLFLRIHKMWRKFMSMELEDYHEHLRISSLLVNSNSLY